MDETHDAAVRPAGLRTDDASGQVATAFAAPRLSWRLAAERPGVRQCAYEVQVSADAAFAKAESSGRVACASPVGAPWVGAPLRSREVRWARVRVWTDAGVTGWNEPVRIEGALFEPVDWVARPISPAFNVGQRAPCPVPLLRRAFTLDRPVASARLYVTALGVHDCRINGAAVSDALLDPGWTAYRDRLLYAVHDVTGLLREGENVIAATVGDGWWRGNLTWMQRRAVYGETTALLAQLELTFADGSRRIVATGEDWQGGTGPLIRADLYDGCELDLGREPGGWGPVVALPLPAGLEQRAMPPVREVQAFDAGFAVGEGGVVKVDCGQNLTGYLRLTLRCTDTAAVTVRHAEVLEPDGRLHTAALRHARATDSYRLPPGEHVVSPSFTYHGFRFAEIALGEGVELERVEVCVVASDLAEIGRFRCSDPRLNQLESNIRWSQRGNFLALPTDCPQRDERLGWTGDIQVFAPTACTNFDARAFLASWLADLALEQAPDGNVPSTVPNVIGGHPFEYAGIGWSDAATLVPLALYEAYGDGAVFARQLPSMRAWVDHGAARLSARDTWEGDFHLGDWLDPGAPPDKPEQATTDRDFIASAYLSCSAAAVARALRVTGEGDAAEHYARLAARVAVGTWARWRDVAVRTQAGCAIAIMFDIAPADERDAVGAALAALVRQAEGRIATGFLGTPLVLPALTRTGQDAAAYALLLNEEAPGWLYQVRSGATTMWERWDAIRPDGTLHGGEMDADDAESMTSFNHYAYGSVGAWLYRTLAGIAPRLDAPGYAAIDFAPRPGGGIAWAEASVATPYGEAAIAWRIEGDGLRVELTVPPGAEGAFHAPPGWVLPSPALPLGSGRHAFGLVRSG